MAEAPPHEAPGQDEQVDRPAGEQAKEAGAHAGQAAKSALAQIAFATVGIGGFLADGVKVLGTSIGHGFVNLAARGRIVLGSVPPQVQEAARSAHAGGGQETPDYERMTVDGLRARARAAGIERPWKMNKEELVRALRQATG